MGQTYLVKQGDTLSAIARRNNTTVNAIAKLNGIADPDKIYSGQTLTLPDSKATSAGGASGQPKGGANQTALAASNKDSASPVGVCPCSGDMSLVPVRYAIDERPASKGGKQPHPLPGGPTFKGGLALKGSAYTLRQLRDGWLYVFDETAKELDEYEVKGSQFIHASKGAKGHVIYPRSATLSLCYSPQPWSERIKTQMSDAKKGEPLRSQWMRKLSLPAFIRKLASPHGATIDQLDKVADMSGSNQGFALSCTPLSKDADEDQQGEIRLLSHKEAHSPSLYKASMPDPNSAMMIVLDDPLAEVADLSMVVNSLMAQQEALLGSNGKEREQTSHKLMMAEVTRNLARVRVEEQDLPASVRGNVGKTYEFETALDEYLGYRHLEQIDDMWGEPSAAIGGRSPLAKLADEKRQQLAKEYGFSPSREQEAAWQGRSRFQNEVDWQVLKSFVDRYQAPLAELAQALALAHQDLSAAISHLKADPLPLGLDPEQVKGQAYLSLLFAEVGQALSASCQDESAAKAIKALLSTPGNLLTLGPYGFDVTMFKGLTTLTVEPSWLTGSSGDMAAFWSRFADLETLVGDENIKQKGWYQASAAVLDAMREASLGLAKGAREALLAVVLPYGNVNNPGTLLRLILLESLLGEQAIKLAPRQPYLEKMNLFMAGAERLSKRGGTNWGGGYPSKNHQVAQDVIKQQKILNLMQEMPELMQLKAETYTEAGRQYIRGYLARVSEALGSGKRELFTALNSNDSAPNMGTFGGLVALINLWNLLVVMRATRQNFESMGGARAAAQFGAAFGWAGNAVMALYQGQAWTALQGEKTTSKRLLLKLSIKEAMKSSDHVVIVKTFTNRMLAFAGFGLLAAAVEAWDTFEAAKDPLLGDVERLLMVAKTGVLFGQGVVFGLQVVNTLLSHTGLISISAIFATWMLVSLFVLGVAYLLLTVLINIFKRSELERWLAQSTWGTQPNKTWTAEQELKALEHIVHKPAARIVTKATSSRFSWGGTSYDHYLEIDLPGYLQGQSFDIQLRAQPQLGIGQMAGIRSIEDVERLAAGMTPYVPALRGGRWQGSQFSLWLGPQNSEYRLTLSYGGLYGGELAFSGKAIRGEMTVSASSVGGLTMTTLPVGTAKG